MFRVLRKRITSVEDSILTVGNQIATIIGLLTTIKGKHFEYDEVLDTIMKMIAELENNNNARYIATQQKLIIFEKIIRENDLDKQGLLSKIVN